jgi:hypothetical protein
MSLLQSAIDAIELGVEDFESNDQRRTASAVRNFYAGVLLLLKEKLRVESPVGSDEALLRDKIRARRSSGGVVFVGHGKKTVDLHGIIERYKDLGLSLDHKRLLRLAEIRNEFEHYVSKAPIKAVQGAIEATFVLVAAVLQDHLAKKPTAVFTKGTWDTILAEAETYKEMSDRCAKSIDSLTSVPDGAADALRYLQCPGCESELLESSGDTNYYSSEYHCCACGAHSELSTVIESALEAAYAGEAYKRGKDGEEGPIGTCPNCCLEAFSTDADVCLACGEGRAYEHCNRCGNDLGLDEQETGLCSYCQHVSDKD